MTFLERYGLVQYARTRSGGYVCAGPCELHEPGEDYCGPFLVLDHCHFHGWVRGVICQSWNMQLAGPLGLEARLRAGAISFGCSHAHRVQKSADRCLAHLRRISDRWQRADRYLRNCPECRIPELAIRWPVLR